MARMPARKKELNQARAASYIGKGIVPPDGGGPILQTLIVSPSVATIGTAFTGSVSGKTAGSTLTLTGAGAAGLSINGTTITGTPTTAGVIHVVETLAGATGSPKTNAARVTTAVAAPVLATLALTAAAFTPGAAAGTVIGSISGKTAGSTITVTPNDGRLAVSSDGSQLLVGVSASSAGTISATLTETLAGATGSPKDTAVTVTVAAALPSLRDLAMFDINFADGDYKGGIQPDTVAGSDARMFKVTATQTQPSYVPNKDGTLTAKSTTATTIRRSDRGAWIESNIATGINPILWSRDLTQAPWVKAGCTAALTRPGRVVPAVANTASRVVVVDAGATVLQTTTLAAGLFSMAFDIRRLVGTGTVEVTLDGGATWTAISPTGNMREFFIPQQTVTNPIVGFRFGTPGDEFEIDMVRGSRFPYAHTPLVQVGATRTQYYDRYSTGIAGGSASSTSGLLEYLRDNADWGVYVEWNTRKTISIFLFGQIVRISPAGTVQASTNDSTFMTYPTAPRVSDTLLLEKNNRALFWHIGGTGYLCVNGGEVQTVAGTFGAYTALDHKDLGSNGAGAVNLDGVMPRVAIIGADGLSQLAANAQRLTTPVDYSLSA